MYKAVAIVTDRTGFHFYKRYETRPFMTQEAAVDKAWWLAAYYGNDYPLSHSIRIEVYKNGVLVEQNDNTNA